MNNNQPVQPVDVPQPYLSMGGGMPTPTVIEPSKSPRRKTLFLALGGLIFTTIVTGSLLGFYFFYSRKADILSWQSLKPGISTKREAVKVLGTPTEEKQTLLGKALLYQSDNPVFPNTLVLDEKGVVESIFVQVPVDEPIKFSEWLKDYGEPEKEMYNSYSAFTKTYISPKKGVAVVANKDFDQVYSLHYFKPTNLEDYLSRWGKYLFEENPYLY